MKKFTLLFFLFISSYSYSQEIMNFYIEPNGENEVALYTLVHDNTLSTYSNFTISTIDNTITVAMCYLNSSATQETFDQQTHDLSLPIGYNTYTIIVELYGDGDNLPPCSYTNFDDTGSITFDYPYDNTATTYIPDNVFEDYLEDFGFGDNVANNDLVFTHRIENMTNLFLNNIPEDIYSLVGIKYFKELKDLRCNNHQITSLDTSENVKLEWLWCNGNPISLLNITNNINLTWLQAYDMNLSEIDVSQNINLEILSVQSNNLNNIDISQNLQLKTVSISSNNIENIDISNNIALERFSCSNTLITSLNTSNNVNLKGLSFNDSLIPEIDLLNNILLESLDFKNSMITNIDVSSLVNLELISAWDSQLTTLDLSNNPQLESVFLFNNALTSLNLKNGNNANITGLATQDNVELFCIDVDEPDLAPYPDWHVDDWTTFSEDCTLGVNEFSHESITLLPNPVSTILTIVNTSTTQIKTIKIYDVLGRLVFQKDTQFNSIDVSQLTSGLLFVNIETELGDITKKVVKQ
jgi:hypothetical protein